MARHKSSKTNKVHGPDLDEAHTKFGTVKYVLIAQPFPKIEKSSVKARTIITSFKDQ